MMITVKDIPPYLAGSLIRKRGKSEAEAWINMALRLTAHLSLEWDFEPLGTFNGGTKSLCVFGLQDKKQSVLKISPIPSMGALELCALNAWQGLNVPQILHTDTSSSSFLMTYLTEEFTSDVSPLAVINLASTLHRSDFHDVVYPPLEQNIDLRFEWAQRRVAQDTLIAHRNDLVLARDITTMLLASIKRRRLIHGDFQMKNMVNTASGLHAIDPMPCIGDPLFDPALWMIGVSSADNISSLLNTFREILCSDDYNRFALWAWCLDILENEQTGTQMERGKGRAILDSLPDSVLRNTGLTSITV